MNAANIDQQQAEQGKRKEQIAVTLSICEECPVGNAVSECDCKFGTPECAENLLYWFVGDKELKES